MFISFSASRLVCRHYKQATTSDENGEMMEIHHWPRAEYPLSPVALKN
ncbi:hypothetical protein [Klebsiella quasipneumoniae]